MKKVLYNILILVVLSIVSGFSLSKMYNYAQPKIAAGQQEAIRKAIFNIYPETADYSIKKLEGESIYFCYNAHNELIGYIFKAQGMGYQGKIIVLAGINKALKQLKGIEILEHSETPGLGAEITKQFFKKQFKNLRIYPKIEYTKTEPTEDNQIKAITGATVSSKSVVNLLNKRIEEIVEVLENYNK